MTDAIHPIHAKEHSLIDELEREDNKPTKERRYFIYGYMNATHGRMDYDSSFFGSDYRDAPAKDEKLLTAFLAGVQDATNDNVAWYGGMSDAYKLIADEKVRGVSKREMPPKPSAKPRADGKVECYSYRELVTQAFFDGIADGYRRIFEKGSLTTSDVGAFILAAGEQARRDGAMMGPIPYGMEWTHPAPAYYKRVIEAIPQLYTGEKAYNALLELVESFPHSGDSTEYQVLLTENDIHYLIGGAKTLGELNVIQDRLDTHFKPECCANVGALKAKAGALSRALVTEGDNLQYTNYARNISFGYRPSGIVGAELQHIETEFNAQAREVGNRKTDSRLFVVFNDVTGLCIVEKGASDLKTGIFYSVLSTQEALPDVYLPPRRYTQMPDGGTAEERAECQALMDQNYLQDQQQRRGMYQKMRENLPEIRECIQQMGL